MTGMPISPIWDQDSYRWRFDDASETAATWQAAANTAPPLAPIGYSFRLRFLIQETAGTTTSPVPSFGIEYRRNTGGGFGAWTTVPAANNNTGPVQMDTSPHAGAGGSTQQLGAGTFRGGAIDFRNPSLVSLSASLGNDEYEMEFVLVFPDSSSSPASVGDIFEFRVTESGAALGTYTRTPSVTIGTTDVEQLVYRWRFDDGSETAATWMAAADTTPEVIPLDQAFRVRVGIHNKGTAWLGGFLRWQYDKNLSGSWLPLGSAASADIAGSASGFVSDNASTTQQITTGTFRAGRIKAARATDWNQITGALLAGEKTELELTAKAQASATVPIVNGDQIRFRLVSNADGTNDALGTYTATPNYTQGVPVQQQAFRVRNDDGSETTATWRAALNTNPTDIGLDEGFRVRFLLDSDSTGRTHSSTWRLQYRINQGAGFGSWADVPALGTNTDPVRLFDSTNITSSTASTQQIGGGTFTAGALSEVQNVGSNLPAGNQTEVEFAVVFDSDATTPAGASDVVELRVVSSAWGSLYAYTQTPSLTIFAAAALSITADAGSYALTGAQAGLELGRVIQAEASSYALTGADAGLAITVDRSLVADAGSYALTGAQAGLELGRVIVAEASSYALTGAQAGLELGRVIQAEASSYALTGAQAGLELGRVIQAEASSYALTGADAGLSITVDRSLIAEAGSYALEGGQAGLELGRVIQAATSSYALSGSDAGLNLVGALMLAAEPGSYSLAGSAAQLELGQLLEAQAGDYQLTGAQAGLGHDLLLEAAGGVYQLTGADAALNLAGAAILLADAGSYALEGAQAGLEHDQLLEAVGGSYALEGAQAGLGHDLVIEALGASYGLSGSDALLDLAGAAILLADAGSYALAGAQAGLERNQLIEAEASSYTLTGSDAGLGFGLVLEVEPGGFALSGSDAGLVWIHNLEAVAGSYALAGSDAGLVAGVAVQTRYSDKANIAAPPLEADVVLEPRRTSITTAPRRFIVKLDQTPET